MTPASQPCGTWGCRCSGSACRRGRSPRRPPARAAARSAMSLSETMQPVMPCATCACGAAASHSFMEPHSSASKWPNVIQRSRSTRHDPGYCRRDEREHPAQAGVEQQRLVAQDEELVEGEAGGRRDRRARRSTGGRCRQRSRRFWCPWQHLPKPPHQTAGETSWAACITTATTGQPGWRSDGWQSPGTSDVRDEQGGAENAIGSFVDLGIHAAPPIYFELHSMYINLGGIVQSRYGDVRENSIVSKFQ